jgi:hypothetical protein
MGGIVSTPIQAVQKQVARASSDQWEIPQLESNDISTEEQDMLDLFEIKKPSLFWQLVQRVGGTIVVRYSMAKQFFYKKARKIRSWWQHSAHSNPRTKRK